MMHWKRARQRSQKQLLSGLNYTPSGASLKELRSLIPEQRFKQGNVRNQEMQLEITEECTIRKSDEYLSKPSIYSTPFYYGLVFYGIILLGYGVVHLLETQLPNPLFISDEKTHPDAFIAERAQLHVKDLTNFGPRVIGSHENEVLTVNYLQQEITKIIKQAHTNQKIELDIQLVSGAYVLDNSDVGKINVYSHVQNVVAKMYSKSEQNTSLLLNVHFDTVPTSPGATDDGINCAVLLEILRKLSKRSERSQHNIIFLFNGAEETALQASHGFITQQKWANESKVFINLESAGSGGKIILFQTGPGKPWLTEVYKDVPHPAGHTLFEELFQANLMPCDSDFRIFRDFGHIPGMDMAFYRNGYFYHTKYDDFDSIPLGTYQHVGDNVMVLVNNIMHNPEVTNTNPKEGHVIFYDYMMSVFFISYTTNAGIILNIFIVLTSIAVFITSLIDFKLGFTTNILIYLLKTFSAILSGWILGGVLLLLVAFLLDVLGCSMSWFAKPWLVFGLHVIPISIGMSSTHLLVAPKNLSPNVNCHVQLHVTRLIWTVLLLITTLLGIRSNYILMHYVLFNTLGFICIHLFRVHHSKRLWQIIYLFFALLPTMLFFHLGNIMLHFYIPTTGRIGNGSNPEILVGFVSYLLTLSVGSQFVSFISFLRKPLYFLGSLSALFLFTFLLVLTPFGFPYSGVKTSAAPQRFWIMHSQRIFHGEDGTVVNRDSGYFLLNMDRHSPQSVRNYVDGIDRAIDVRHDCSKYLLCGLPLPHTKMFRQLKGSSWIPAQEPIIDEPVTLQSSRKLNRTLFTYNITISGPDRIYVFLSPKENIKLLRTNLVEELPAQEGQWNGRPFFFFIHVCAKELVPFEFTLDFEVPVNYEGLSADIAIAGIHVHENKSRKTKEYKEFLSQFPEWADVTAWVATYESWSI